MSPGWVAYSSMIAFLTDASNAKTGTPFSFSLRGAQDPMSELSQSAAEFTATLQWYQALNALANAEKVNHEDERLTRQWMPRASNSVCKSWWHDQCAAAAHTHARDSLLPTCDQA